MTQNIINHFLLIIACLGFCWSIYHRYRARVTKKWVPTKAKVCNTSIDYKKDSDGKDYYVGKILYEYN